jgi:hypothetical protein
MKTRLLAEMTDLEKSEISEISGAIFWSGAAFRNYREDFIWWIARGAEERNRG